MNSIPLTFILKKIMSAFLQPLPFSLAFVIIGLILLWFTKKQKIGKTLVTSGTILLIFFASDLAALFLVSPLESIYQPYRSETNKKIDYVVVLDGGGIFRIDVPPGVILKPSGTIGRLLEGISIYKENPGCKLVLDGPFIKNTNFSEADVLAKVAIHYGVNRNDIIKVPGVLDTTDEAIQIKGIVGGSPFILVTSAIHLPRAMLLFKKQGLNPIPAPAAFLSSEIDDSIIFFPIPGGGNIVLSEQALHEYIGIFWARICGKI